MFSNKPKMAKKWAAHTPKGADLPEHVKKANLIFGWVMNGLEKRAAADSTSTFPSNPAQAWKPDSTSAAAFTAKAQNHPPFARERMDSTATQKMGSPGFPQAGNMMAKRETAMQWAAKDPALAQSRRAFVAPVSQQLSEAGNKGRAFISDTTITPKTSWLGYPKRKGYFTEHATVNAFKASNPAVDSLRSWYPQTRGWLK